METFTQTSDPRLLTALVRWSTSPEGKEVLSWLEGIQSEQDAALRSLVDDRNMRQMQGSAQFLVALLEAIKTAKVSLEGIKESQQS